MLETKSIRDVAKTKRGERLVWGHEYLSQPDKTLFRRIPYIQDRNECVLPMAEEEDVVILSTKITSDYYNWLRLHGFSTENIYLMEKPEETNRKYCSNPPYSIPELIIKNRDQVKQFIDRFTSGKKYFPRYCSFNDILAAEQLGLPIFGCDSSLVSFLYDKAKFKMLCVEAELPVVPGELFDPSKSTLEQYWKTLKKYQQESDEAIQKSLQTSNGAGMISVSKECLPETLPHEKVLIEPKLRVRGEYSTLAAIREGEKHGKEKGEILSATEQIVRNFKHKGNKYLKKPDPRIIDYTSSLIEIVSSMGYIGPLGIDFLETKTGEIYISEANPRLTGPAPAWEVLHKLNQRYKSINSAQYIKLRTKPQEFSSLQEHLIDLIFDEKEGHGIFPLDITMLSKKGTFAALITSPDTSDNITDLSNYCNRILEELERRGIYQ